MAHLLAFVKDKIYLFMPLLFMAWIVHLKRVVSIIVGENWPCPWETHAYMYICCPTFPLATGEEASMSCTKNSQRREKKAQLF